MCEEKTATGDELPYKTERKGRKKKMYRSALPTTHIIAGFRLPRKLDDYYIVQIILDEKPRMKTPVLTRPRSSSLNLTRSSRPRVVRAPRPSPINLKNSTFLVAPALQERIDTML